MPTNSTWRMGAITGLLGAATVALWFLFLDLLAGRPLATPRALGASVLAVLGVGADSSSLEQVLFYTLLHVLVFLGIGMLLAVIVRGSRKSPASLAGLLLLFGVFQAAFHAVMLLFAYTPELGAITWTRIGVANLLATGVMLLYLMRAEPGLSKRFAKALDGRSSK